MKNLKKFLLLALFFCYSAESNAQIGTWQIHQGSEGVIDFPTRTDQQRVQALDKGKGTIPSPKDAGWKNIANDAYGNLKYSSGSNIKSCANQVDYTYFQNTLNLTDVGSMVSFQVSIDIADDGARIYLFNSKYPNGYFDPQTDIIRMKQKEKLNLKDQLAEGQNRIVIVHFDQCAPGNNITGVRINMEQLPTKFKLHAYSINGKRDDKGSNNWIAVQGKGTGSGIVTTPDKQGTILNLERKTIANGIIALKVTNADYPDSYLFVDSDKNVKIGPINSKENKHHFKVKAPEEQAASNLDFVSFESVVFPGNYLRHQSYILKVSPGDEANRKDIVYRQDASWLFVKL